MRRDTCFITCRIVFLIIRPPPSARRTDARFPYTTLFRAEQPHDRLGDLVGLAEATHRGAPAQLLELVLVAPHEAAEHRRAHAPGADRVPADRSEDPTSELQSLMRISYAAFCLKQTNMHTDFPPLHTTLYLYLLIMTT